MKHIERLLLLVIALAVGGGLGLVGTGIRFKHPVSHFEDSMFEKLDCGFINDTCIV